MVLFSKTQILILIPAPNEAKGYAQLVGPRHHSRWLTLDLPKPVPIEALTQYRKLARNGGNGLGFCCTECCSIGHVSSRALGEGHAPLLARAWVRARAGAAPVINDTTSPGESKRIRDTKSGNHVIYM